MEFFHNGNAVRLRSHHQRYLFAKDDQETVGQDKDRSSNGTRWTVEFVTGFNSVIRLKSCYGKYLTASDQPLILEGLGSSMKVAQTRPSPVDSTIEWEPIRVGQHIRLKSRHHSVDSFLRGSGRFRLYSVSHYPPHEHTTPAPQPSAPNRPPGSGQYATPAPPPCAPNRPPSSGQGDTTGKWQQGVETVGAIAGLVGAIADLVSNSRCG